MVARRGSGGAGIVYRAIDDRLGRTVAIKLLQRGLADDPIFLRRFRDEAQAAAQLNHPNIMKVFDWGSDEGEEPYLVMEYLSNGSLRELHARGGSLSTSQVVQIGAATASALAYSHHRNFLHRDIKPANLLFDDGGRVRIADFGLVRALSETTVTETGGGILGTPRYMAPEQVEGKRSVPGSDVYSLGLVLYEALFGAIPFQGDTQLALAFARLRDPVVNPLPDDPVARSIVSMLERDPDGRPSAAEIEHEWNGFARDLTNPEPLFALGAGAQVATPEVVMDDSLQWLADGSTIAVDLTEHLAIARDESSTVVLADETGEGTEHTSALDISNTPRLTPVPQDMEEVGRRRPWWLLFFLLPILVAAGLGGAVLYQRLRTIKVDDVANLAASSASQRLRSEGIAHIALQSRYSTTVPSGRVIGSSPSGGQSVHPDSSVVLYVSKGHAPVYVASYQSAQFTTAQHALTAKGFLVHPTYEYSPDVPAGVVMSESPVNQKVPYHSVVKFVVSKGPAPRPVPNVVGVSLTTAEGDLTNQGFTYSVQKQYSNSVSSGDVISQSVSAGTVSSVGTSVTLVESLGPHYVRVPNVVGDALGTAESTLRSQGFAIGTVSAPFGGSIVQYESPGAGQTALYGASVNLLVIP